MYDYKSQYFKTYKYRLDTFRTVLRAENSYLKNLSVIQSTVNNDMEEFNILGVLICSTGIKPTIFDEIVLYGREETTDTYYTSDMKFFLEDETGSIELHIPIELNQILSTGMVLGVTCIRSEKIYEVKNIFYPNTQLYFSGDILKRKILILNDIFFTENFVYFALFIKLIQKKFYDVDDIFFIGPFFKNLNLAEIKIFNNLIEKITKKIYLVPEKGDILCNVVPYKDLKNIFLNKHINYIKNPNMINQILFLPEIAITDLVKYKINGNEEENKKFSEFRADRIKSTYSIKFSKEDYKNAAEQILKCKYMIPSAPDTVRSEPFNSDDYFFLREMPKKIFIGGKGEFYESKINNIDFVIFPSFNLNKQFSYFDGENYFVYTIEIENN